METYPFKSGLHMMEPVALPNYNVNIQYAKTSLYRKVLYIDSIPPFQFLDLGTILAAGITAPTGATLLQVNDNQFAQIRWYPIDHVSVAQFLPQANAMHNMKNVIITIDENIVTRDPDLHFTEFFVWQQNNPFFVAFNYTSTTKTMSRLIGQGFRYIVTEEDLPSDTIANIQAGVTPCVVIPCSGGRV